MLEILGASVLHGVDATKMKILPDIRKQKFHRIIFNFPHAGFHRKEDNPVLIKMHRALVRGFFRNARSLLRHDGEIHVNHKVTTPLSEWRIEDLASDSSLAPVGCRDFDIRDYPGYCNKRGSGSRCDHPFPLRKSKTFMFQLRPFPRNMPEKVRARLFTLDDAPFPEGLMSDVHISEECYEIFGGYLHNVEDTFGATDYYDASRSVRNALERGSEAYMDARPRRRRRSSRYIGILEELRHLSVMRTENLRDMLLQFDRKPRARGPRSSDMLLRLDRKPRATWLRR